MYRCTDAGCPMAAVDLPDAAARASSLHCPLCRAALSPMSEGATQTPYPAGLDPEGMPSYLTHPWKGYWEEEHPRVRLAWLVDTAALCVRHTIAAGRGASRRRSAPASRGRG